jgi:DNA ligase-1
VSASLAQLVAAAGEVAASSSRTAKVEAMAALLRRLDPAHAAIAAAYLAGDPPQGRIGVGWATVGAVQTAAATDATLTLADVASALDDLAATVGPGSAAEREGRLRALLGRATSAEADFLRRLLLGDLRQGANEGLVVEAIAAAADIPAAAVRRALMLAGELGPVTATALTAGRAGLDAVRLEVGRPLRPMLAATSPDVASAVAELGRCSVEWKLDGARVQVHRAGDTVRIVTRNLNDITARHPGLVEVVRGLPAERFVLDGEVLGLADEGDGPRAFQDTISGFARDRGDAGLVPWFFDCLHLNGADLVDAPLTARLDALAFVGPDRRVPGVVTADADAAAQVLADALGAGHEGVMVKAADAPYQAGRRGKTWRKVKPVHTYDLVVLGAEWGHGRRTGWLSNLHLGALDPLTGGFVMVGKTFKGLTDETLRWQTEALLAREQHRDGITVFVRPELVVEIAIDGVQRSSRYPGGVALRFARVKGYRPDKRADGADTITTLQALLG